MKTNYSVRLQCYVVTVTVLVVLQIVALHTADLLLSIAIDFSDVFGTKLGQLNKH